MKVIAEGVSYIVEIYLPIAFNKNVNGPERGKYEIVICRLQEVPV